MAAKNTKDTMIKDSQKAQQLVKEREIVANLLENIPSEIVENIAHGKNTNRDTNGINGAREGLKIWQEEGAPDIYEMDLQDANSLSPGNVLMGYYKPGDEHINVMELFDEQRAVDLASYSTQDAEEKNCIIDMLTNEADREIAKVHEGQHMKNYSKGIYEPTSDHAWLGCEATAKINAADEIGARITELSYIRDVYIKAGGGKEGLNSIKDIASASNHNAMINEYISKIESGEINPMSNKVSDQKHEFETMGRIVHNQWVNDDQEKYTGQLSSIGLQFAYNNHLNNVKFDQKETKRRCDQAMTVDMTVNGKTVPISFGQYLPEITLPEKVQTQMSILDKNQDLVAEYAKNGKDAFNDKTSKMEDLVMTSKGADSKQVNQDPSERTQTNTSASTNKAVQAALDSKKLTR